MKRKKFIKMLNKMQDHCRGRGCQDCMFNISGLYKLTDCVLVRMRIDELTDRLEGEDNEEPMA